MRSMRPSSSSTEARKQSSMSAVGFGPRREVRGCFEMAGQGRSNLRGGVCSGPSGDTVVEIQGTHEAAGLRIGDQGRLLYRFGFDLFREVEHLLCSGQPVNHASIPTLDIHIELLRDCILSAGVPLVEIPPFPPGHRFVGCLTHDVDFVGIRTSPIRSHHVRVHLPGTPRLAGPCVRGFPVMEKIAGQLDGRCLAARHLPGHPERFHGPVRPLCRH